MGIKVEYTAPSTMQQYGRFEHKFVSLYNRACGMLNCWKFSLFLRNRLWTKVANTAKT